MLFQSQIYILLFLPIVIAVYYLGASSAAVRQWVLLAASLIFYGWWDARFIPLVITQIGVTWLLALAHAKTKWRAFLGVGVIVNLASLCTFKYLDFLIASAEAILRTPLPRAGLVLPIGISFFSFQLISYLIDRLRNDAPIYSIRQFALFVLLFPHLIAGPIVRHNELIPQFSQNPVRPETWRNIAAGILIFTLGLAKKVLLADPLAAVVDPLFSAADATPLGFVEAWTAVLGFSFQLFLDFSAYTEMAIGTALLFGIILPENFKRPYLATDLRDFWRRWHITLSAFIRDYLYIPLGGGRHGWKRYVFATLTAMAICGLWHGAGWTYVAWGLWHGLGLIVCRVWFGFRLSLPRLAAWTATMLFVVIGWVLFRAHSFDAGTSILASMFLRFDLRTSVSASTAALLAAAALASVALPTAHEIKDGLGRSSYLLALATALVASACVVMVGEGAPAAFIYFQF